ncbi:hypothetical protein [Nonomuraea sp. NPDC048901]|uniref:hypothetical protein n=1 Tax=Nonomuraea sp. NPDC048901 TaxID=3155627 RepID=UPI0033E322A7
MTREPLGKTTEPSEPHPRHSPISESAAAEHDQALAELRELLTRRGIHSYVVEWLKLTLRSAPFPADALSSLDRYPPELVVFAPQGWRVATVRIAADRSAAYVVEVARIGEDHGVMPDIRYIVPSGKPAKAAALIPG